VPAEQLDEMAYLQGYEGCDQQKHCRGRYLRRESPPAFLAC
jgi:hypothetical protein